MLAKIFLAIAAAVILLIVVVAIQPSTFNVSRTATIDAPPAAVFALVNDFHQWETWSPWAKLDPNAKISYEGADSGKGAIFRWSGNSEVGEGSNTIVESRPNESIRIRLEFLKPLEGTSTSEFTFQPEGGKTVVTWKMSGENNFIGKAVGLVMNCDKMIGGQFEQGLANLDSAAKAAPRQ